MSRDGVAALMAHEGEVPGLYDDPAGCGTYGVGHLVHPEARWPSFLLAAARAPGAALPVATLWPGTERATFYLAAEDVARTGALAALSAHALQVAQAHIGAAAPDLTATEVHARAEAAVAREAGLLQRSTRDVLRGDLERFEAGVSGALDGYELTQGEFDALVSFAFNVGVDAFAGSTLLRRIRGARHRFGARAERLAAIAEIEAEFARWTRAGGQVLDVLVRRRADEAAAFLMDARADLPD